MLPANDVASVIIQRGGRNLTRMALQKLVYYVQAWHLAITDEPLFPEQVKAWERGPVVPQVWHNRKEWSSRTPAEQNLQTVVLDEISSSLIDLVLDQYGAMGGDELSALTHAETPWKDVRGDLPEDAASSAPIPQEAMAEFYRSHRKLGGRTAVDLAATGVYVSRPEDDDPIDFDMILASLDDDDDDDDDVYNEAGHWRGAVPDGSKVYSGERIRHDFRRARVGA